MHSRPLLDYLTDPAISAPDDAGQGTPAATLEARLSELQARLRPREPEEEKSDLTLSAQIEGILKRKASLKPPQSARLRPADPPSAGRVIVDAPSMQAHSQADVRAGEPEFMKFAEAVYLIGQAAKRFIDQPQFASAESREAKPVATSPSDIDALTAALRETVSAFRSVADDLAVSAGEIRNFATRDTARGVDYRAPRRHARDDEEILELRDTVADLQDRLDGLLRGRRRARY